MAPGLDQFDVLLEVVLSLVRVGLALLFVYVFLLSFQHFDHLVWGRGSWSLCLSCICLLAMHTLICVTFSFPPGVWGWLRLLIVALPGLFC